MRTIWSDSDEVRRLSAFYRFPRTAREAHLLFSHDRRRIIDSFRWVLSMQPFEAPIVDFGCGTGTLLRLIAREHRDLELVGIDCAENLIEIARSLSSDFENASFLSGDFTEVVEEPQFGTITRS